MTQPQLSVVHSGHNELEIIAGQIQAAHDRLVKDGAAWVEDTLDLAKAMVAGRDKMPTTKAFSEWLKDRGLDFYNKTDRAAVLKFGENLEVARDVLQKTPSRSYQNIARDNKDRFPQQRRRVHARMNSGAKPSTSKKKGARRGSRMDLHRRFKLGDATVDALKGTTLGSAVEMDELIRLNIGATEGEHTPVVAQLIADAVAGKNVSATAVNQGISKRKPPVLIKFWRERMNTPWQQSVPEKQDEFAKYFMTQIPPARRDALITFFVDNMLGKENGHE